MIKYNYIVFIFILVVIDLFSKSIIEKISMKKKVIEIIPNFFEIRYAKNYGAAYSLFEKNKFFLISMNTFLLIFIMYLFYFSENKNEILSYTFILGGGIGNYINRIAKKYVTDFLYIKIKKFPIFNFADLFILTGVILYFLTYIN